ncbi:MAG: hypothetical protein CL678_00570 [Bdellovibrionaceae bacterium]|nr:hypothetical protein [Pseudobdellovibrionaceae bacterium]
MSAVTRPLLSDVVSAPAAPREHAVHVQQLASRGALPRATMAFQVGDEIVVDPRDESKVVLRVEHDLLARVAETPPLPWSSLTQAERVFFRQHHERLALKRLSDGSVAPRGKHGLRHKDDMVSLLVTAPGGVDCFELIAEYPQAHADLLELLATRRAVHFGTEIWDGSARSTLFPVEF